MSIGGNNVNFSDKLKSCVKSPFTCSYAAEDRVTVAHEIAAAHEDILEVYKQLAEKTEGRSKIYALGYPQFIQVNGSSCGVNVGLLNEEERIFINQAVSYLNQVIRSAAEEAGVYYLDLESSLNGRNLCSGAPQSTMAFNGITTGNDNFGVLANETYHPNHLAHELLKLAILGQTGDNPINWQVCTNGVNTCPRGDGLIPLPDISYWGAEAQSYVGLMNDEQSLIAELPPKHQPIIVNTQSYYQPGQEVRVISGGFAPGTEVEVVFHSEPVLLAKTLANSDGFIEQIVTIPEDTELDFHTLHLFGTNTVSQRVDYYESIPVFEQPAEDSVENTEVANNNTGESDETISRSGSGGSGEPEIAEEPETLGSSVTNQGIGGQTANPSVLTDFDVLDEVYDVANDSPEDSFVPVLTGGLLVLITVSIIVIWKKADSGRF
jgi:hypothetical protein